MIALELNKYIWGKLKEDPALNEPDESMEFNNKYNKYRLKYGEDFIPFFPVADNFAGDIAWDSEPYFLYDSISLQPNRQVFGERREQVIYTLVGKIPEILEIRETMVHMFSFWDGEAIDFDIEKYRITNVDVWQLTQASGRDSLRQTYSVNITFEVNYILC
jgi:hypothetical protein